MIACVGKVGSNIVGIIVGGRMNIVVECPSEDLFWYVEGESESGSILVVNGRESLNVKK